MEAPDHELLDRYRRGEVQALDVLVERYRRPLFSYILNMTGRRGDADDVFQESWFRAIRKLGDYREKNFFGWLVRISHNLVIDRIRRQKPEVSLDAESGAEHPIHERLQGNGPSPHGQMEASETGARIRRAVNTLPPEQKAVFLMRVEVGLPFREIARIQRCSINTTLARMHRALGKLRPLLKDEYESLGRADEVKRQP
jgi:RNA polymerase sigma-70 factor, ECF subfamily